MGSHELDAAAEYLLDKGNELVLEAKKDRPDLLVQVNSGFLAANHSEQIVPKGIYSMKVHVVEQEPIKTLNIQLPAIQFESEGFAFLRGSWRGLQSQE